MLKCLLMILLLLMMPQTKTAEQIDPYHLMNNVIKKTFCRLKNEQDKIHKNPNYLRQIVSEELLPYVQIRYVGALVLGRYYSKATPEQRDAYFKAFQNYIEQAYAQTLVFYTNQTYKVALDKLNVNSRVATVRVIVIDQGSRPPIHLNFQWRKNSVSDNWQAYDMVAEGVSMIITKQNECASILRMKGINELTRQLEASARQPISLDN